MLARNAILFVTLGLMSQAHCGQVIWSSAAGARNLTSKAQSGTLDGSFTFELGAFLPGFLPTRENVTLWRTHWVAADHAAYDSVFQSFGGDFIYDEDSDLVGSSAQGYIWGYNWVAGEGSAEWLLITNPDSWNWPDSHGLQFPSHWSVSNASEAIVGSIDDPSGDYHFKTESVTVGVSDLNDSRLWLSQHFTAEQLADSAVGAWESDPDKDGLTNLEEYAFAMEPWAWEADPVKISMPDGSVEYRWPVIDSDRHVDLSMEISSNLLQWESLDELPHPIGDGFMAYRVHAKEQSFVRLRLAFSQES